jgi:hypothetical protein
VKQSQGWQSVQTLRGCDYVATRKSDRDPSNLLEILGFQQISERIIFIYLMLAVTLGALALALGALAVCLTVALGALAVCLTVALGALAVCLTVALGALTRFATTTHNGVRRSCNFGCGGRRSHHLLTYLVLLFLTGTKQPSQESTALIATPFATATTSLITTTASHFCFLLMQ